MRSPVGELQLRGVSGAVPPLTPVRAALGGTQEDLRRHNLATVLTLLHVHGELSRTQLTDLVGLNRSTIAALVTQLGQLGVVQERRPASRSGAGRPSLVVVPDRETVQVLAVDIGVDRVVAALVGLTGWISARRRRPLDRSRSVGSVVAVITELYRELTLERPQARVAGIAVSIPGVVRRSDGLVRLAPNLAWVDQPLGDHLARAFDGLPVWLANDADLGLLAEHRRGVARNVNDAVYVAGEVGVGGAIITAGQSLTGSRGYAGELGHVLIRPRGRLCRCGARGCWETEIGSRALARALGVPERTATDALIAMLCDPAPGTAQRLRGLGQYLGQGISMVVNVVNPTLVVVGGVLAHAYPLVEDVVDAALGDHVLTAAREHVKVTVPQLGDDAVVIGAAEAAWSQLLVDPVAMLTTVAPLPQAQSSGEHTTRLARRRPAP